MRATPAVLLGLIAVVLVTSCGRDDSSAPRELRVLVGAGRATASINEFFPAEVRIRTGDTITWRMNADGDPHTVTFTDAPEILIDIIPATDEPAIDLMFNPDLLHPTREPGEPVETYSGEGYFNSGIFFGLVDDAPPLDKYSLIFDTPGVYGYVCGIHEFMTGKVFVEPATATDVPDQEAIDLQALSEMTPLVDLATWNQQLVASGRQTNPETGPEGKSVWIVNAGIGPREVEVVDFMPKNLTVEQGDTVVWVSSGFHSVVFPRAEPVNFYETVRRPGQPPVVAVNTQVTDRFKPSGEFDGTEFFSSGLIGPGVRGYGTRPDGVGFSLTFTSPGAYAYACPIHKDVGMIGSVTVLAR